MRTKLLTALILSTALLAPATASANRFQVKSGHVKYQLTGQQSGQQDLYWKDFGATTASYAEATVSMMGITQTQRTMNLMEGDWTYSYDDKQKQVTKVNYTDLMAKMEEMGFGGAPQGMSEEMMIKMGGKKSGQDQVLGRKCDVWVLEKFGDSETCVWKGVPLRSEWGFMGFNMKQEAVEINENASIDPAKFQLPVGVPVVEQDVNEMFNAKDMHQAQAYMNDPQKQAEMEAAMKQLQDLQNNPEYQEAMQQMQAMQNDPQFQENMRQMQKMQNSPEYQEALRQQAGSSANIPEKTGQIVTEEAGRASEETLREETRRGVKKGLGNAFKSLF